MQATIKLLKRNEPTISEILEPSEENIDVWLNSIPDWQIVQPNQVKQLQRQYTFKNFVEALAFAQKVADLAEEHNHHPARLIEWGKCRINWCTHTLNGFAENDFILAAESDKLFCAGN